MNKLSIGIVSLNNPDHVNLLIKSLIRNTRNPFEILLHVNGVSTQFDSIVRSEERRVGKECRL